MRSNAVLLVATALFCGLVCPGAAYANLITANSCAQKDVQAAINSANSGDTVSVPGGTCVWASPVTIPSTIGIILSGGGNTTISGSALAIKSNASATTEVTGFTFNGSYTNTVFAITTSGCGGLASCGGIITAPFRIDNNIFTDPSDAGTFIATSGNGPGLIDHNTFTMGPSAEMIHNLGMGASDASGWSDNVSPGGANMLFIETNTFTYNATGNPAYDWGTHAIESYYGSRTVFRYNTLNMCEVDQHGTPGAIWARWWEIYGNTFNTNVANANQSMYMALRGGSGVVFNNSHVGANLASAGITIEVECGSPGTQCTASDAYPELYQVGRGVNQSLSPVYFWNNTDNGNAMTVNSGAPQAQLNRDYFVAGAQPSSEARWEMTTDGANTTYSYTPYTYPYPWSSSTSQTTPPAPVTAVVH